MSKEHHTGEPIKVVVRLDPVQWDRADAIKQKFGYKSIYEINQYLWSVFLRVADPDNDNNKEPIPDEIIDMFADLNDPKRNFDYVKPKR